MISYQKISLFDAPAESVIVHACNAQGVWGGGIAADFKVRYIYSNMEYEHFCNTKQVITGKAGLSSWHVKERHWVGWLITSFDFGARRDSRIAILTNTALAIKDLCEKLYRAQAVDEIEVYSNKFNSGLFGVPWEETEEVLKNTLKHFKRIKWIVCDPELDI
jgi:ADP-ribose 1''-phosphate phosphatase